MLQGHRGIVVACVVPAVARDRVANVLLALRVKGGPSEGAHRAAQDIARQSARDLLGPLLDTACARLGSVLRRAFDIAADVQTLAAGGRKRAWFLMADVQALATGWWGVSDLKATAQTVLGVRYSLLRGVQRRLVASMLGPCSCHVLRAGRGG